MQKNDYQHISDQELLNRFHADHNKQWLGILLERYTLLLLGVCMKYLKNEEEAKDAVQQIFLKALGELEKYPVSYPKSWLYKVACNHCLMKLRTTRINVPLSDTAGLHEEQPDTGEIRAREINLNLLEESLAELNPEQKTCITLFYLRKNSYQDICNQTGYSLLQVKSHIQNGKRNLKMIMEKKKQKLNGRLE
ncbi:MAG TPA: sigma-70 family RNA polymerase sigma factor [Sediminibacterium sp.]|nr:sigma-70 family RNA polymerase sigma factor [Sediminibacterium sp.]